jgi:aminopeptidase N
LTANAYTNVTVSEFLKTMETESGTSLSSFRETWLESRHFPITEALGYLEEHAPEVGHFIEVYKEIRKQIAPVESENIRHWNSSSDPGFRTHLIRVLGSGIPQELWEAGARENDLAVHKALLDSTPEMKPWMQPYLSSWLDAPSYGIRENALFKLWVGDPGNRPAYLDRTASNGSFEAIRLKQLWWLLAMLTPEYKTPELKQSYLRELRRTTAPGYSWETRQNALAMLHQVGALNLENVRDVMQATEHHSWQFRKFSRSLLEEVVSKTPEAADWSELASSFSKEKYSYLYQLIEDL